MSDAEICRFCLSEGGELVAPCECRGHQRLVHLSCLRRWQRAILVTQPTHPALIQEDRRMTHCQVCLARLTVEPLSRHEMMLQFTGAELASLVRQHSLISSSAAWSSTLTARLQMEVHRISDVVHWCRSSYFIYYCGPKQLALSIPDEANRVAVLENLDGQGCLEIRGQRYRLPGLEATRIYHEIQELRLPTEVMLQLVDHLDQRDDTIRAINLSRPIASSDLSAEVQARLAEAIREAQLDDPPELQHFLGGPCSPCKCLALLPSHLAPPSFQCLDCLQVALGDLEDALAALSARKRRRREEPSAETPDTQRPPPVRVFWGEARWQRTQLLGEMAKGDWGLCQATAEDLTRTSLWQHLQESQRPVYAPVSEMTRA